MNLAQSLAFNRAVLAGGPGSGRHPEYGNMHKMLIKHGYRLHPSASIRQDYIHPDYGVHLEVNPSTGGWRRAEYPDHEGGHGAQTLHDYLHGKYNKIAAGGPGSGRHKELWSLHDELKDHPARDTVYPLIAHQADYTNKLEKLYRGLSVASKGHEDEEPYNALRGTVGESMRYARRKLDDVQQEYDHSIADHALASMHSVLSQLTNPYVSVRKRKMAAGGPGSGCHGPNCGRPSTAGNRVGAKFPYRVVRRVEVDQKTKHVFDVYMKNGKVSALIPRSEYPLTGEQRAVEQRFSRMIGSDPQKWIDEYKRLNGNVLNADLAKELSPDYRKDRSTFAAAVHEPASWLIKQIYKEELKKPAEPGKRDLVFFTAGAAGTGKSSAINEDEGAKLLQSQTQIVYDGTLRPATKAIARVQQALDAGKAAAVMFVYRDPVVAFRQGMLGRADRMEKEKGSGRVVTLDEMALQHSSVNQSMKNLYEKFKNYPRFTMGVLDNSYGPGESKRMAIDKIPQSKSYNELKHTFRGILNEEYAKGNISQRVYKAVLGAPGVHKEYGH